MSLRTTHKQMTRTLLLESGLRVFGEKGYSGSTIDEIAVGAGTTRTTFYLHFASKSDLMLALIDEIDEMALGADVPRLVEAIGAEDETALAAWAHRRLEQLAALTAHVRAVEQAASVDPHVAGRVDRWHAEAVDAIAAALPDAIPLVVRRARALLAFAQVEYLSRRWAALPGALDGERATLAAELARALSAVLGRDADA